MHSHQSTNAGKPATSARRLSQPQPGGLLSGVDLFKDLSAEDLAKIERRCHVRRYVPQEQIIDREGASGDVYVVIDGKVRVVNYSASGREISFDDLLPGAYFGEISALDGQPRSATVMAVDNALILAVPRRAFLDVLAGHPEVALKVMRRLAGIVRTANERIMDLSTLAAQNRVQAELLREARQSTVDDGTAVISPIPLHGDIASRVSTTRETVARVMNDLARKGIVKRTKDSLVVCDVDRLESLVEDVRG